ncbi:esterase/lipase family protein [Sphingomonas canadensis]|uniref:Esterase/lipase family protein n=1 Tax=Sphingomonas canadensis TaxID=1219257 RepID=A0ABW3H034_9SPHN|nr:alpha/beta hydrolase [Sphingomonas canadensis]MCW3835295.1 alpha/beta hydrolase [Sphingomonas canadensis]
MAVNPALVSTSPGVPPSRLAFLAETPRAAWNMASLALSGRRLRAAPRGDGRPVMLLPGLGNVDLSNLALLRFLRGLGYNVRGWGLGANLGTRTVGREAERLIARVEAMAAEAGEKVTLVGVSLGGIMARIVAQRRPDLVREVITISAPFAGPPTSTNVWRAFELLSGERISDPGVQERSAEAAAPLPVPATAIWSRSDGLVNGLICHDGACRSIEIESSHLWVQFKPEVLLAVAGTLAGDTGQWSNEVS